MTESWKSRGVLLTLLSLKDKPKHGYEIAAHLKEKTAGFFTISFGALYPILHKLEKDGLIAGAWEDAGVSKRKKVYSLTPAGERALEEERGRYEAFAGAFAKLLGEKP
jgi:DNA-binding PadR family transcriptional regulator